MASPRNRIIIGLIAAAVVLAVIFLTLVRTERIDPHPIPTSVTPALTETLVSTGVTDTPTAASTATSTNTPEATVTGSGSGSGPTDYPIDVPTETAAVGNDDPTSTPTAPQSADATQTFATAIAAVQQTATKLAEAILTISPTPNRTPVGGNATITPRPTLPDTGGGGGEVPLEDLVSSANIFVRNPDSGAIIGSGIVRIYAPAGVQYPSTARIELELSVENVYITPTPFGDITSVPRETSTPRPGIPTATPYEPIFDESDIDVYQRMGASLVCAEISFTGCDSPYDLENVKLIAENVTTWSWILTPNQDVSGLLDLELKLWAVRVNPDESYDTVDVWSHGFQIRSGAFGQTSPLPAAVFAGAVVVILAGAAWVIQRRSKSSSGRALTDKPQVFISYRRGASWAQARSIANSIRARGIPVFIDIDNIDEGRFAEIIAKAIEECPYFVPILSPATLESPWVVREIVSAIQHKKRIIPVLTDGFNFYAATLPEEIREIASHNAITLTPEFYEEAIDRLVKRFIKDSDD